MNAGQGISQDESSSGALERVDVVGDRPLDWNQYEHRSRYVWADEQITGPASILDVACGTGHGSEILASNGRVTGIDQDPSAIERAGQRTDGRFIQASVPPLPLDSDSFDYVVSFETIEHLEHDEAFLVEIQRVLKEDGWLLISSPNSAVSSPDADPSNEFHLREYTLAQFTSLIEGAGFVVVELLGQRSERVTTLQRRIRGVAYRLRGLGRWSGAVHRLIFERILDMGLREQDESELPAFWVVRARPVGSPPS